MNIIGLGLGIKYVLRSGIKHNSLHITRRSIKILGIETSCDDTGCAVVDDRGCVLGEALHSQQETHLEHGGIIPPVARDLHKAAIRSVVDRALQTANLDLQDIDAIATTVKPGLPLSLLVGMNYGKHLSRTSRKPFIPIHHMEAHALTIRMVEQVEFPFLVLLISGGHCLLAVAQSVSHFQLLGHSVDDAPGEAFDKASRRLKMRNIAEFRSMSGGEAVELAASRGDPRAYEMAVPMRGYRDCNFSYSGFRNSIHKITTGLEKKYEVMGGQTLPIQVIYDICASLLYTVTSHLCHRVQRAIEFVRVKQLIPPDKQKLVISGGVACNKYIRQAVETVSNEYDYSVHVPPPHLCTDNGIMIAWNGIEKWRAGGDIHKHDNLDCIDIEAKCPLGEDLTQEVLKTDIKCKWIEWYKILKNTDSNAVPFNKVIRRQ